MNNSLTFDDVTLQYHEAGDPHGPLALLLHGFPDTNHTFRYLMPYLAELGYHVVAPAMRGYAPSSIATTGDYQTATLAHDAIRLHDALQGDGSAVLIGHDWGAAGTYPALSAAPERWRKAVTMSVPPLALMAQAFMTFDQLQRSWYMFYFQSPLADVTVPLGNFDFIERLWRDWSPNYDSAIDVQHVREALAEPAHLAAALGYYRAMFQPPASTPELAPIHATFSTTPSMPVLYLHGENDGCIGTAVVNDTLQHLAVGSEMHIVANAGHFLHLEQPDEVHHLIGEFLGR